MSTITFRSPVTKPLYPFARRSDGPNPARKAGDRATFEVTSPFGRREWVDGNGKQQTDFHGGLDIGNGWTGDTLVAMAAGKVLHAGWLGWPWSDGYGGNMVVVDHAPGVVTLFAHMESVAVHVGQQLSAGHAVGRIGHSSSVAIPGHVHAGLQAPASAVPSGVARNATKTGLGTYDVDLAPFLFEGATLVIEEEGLSVTTSGLTHVVNRATKLTVTSNFRADATRAAGVLETYDAGTKVLPTVEVTGEAIGTNAKWLGAWMYLANKGYAFGFFHSSVLAPLTPVEQPDCSTEVAAAIADEAKRVDLIKGDAAQIVPILERMRSR